jgi:hypothetical protein
VLRPGGEVVVPTRGWELGKVAIPWRRYNLEARRGRVRH